tara:strand:+ start:27196 stop:29688 length:2493 start_codon:yes stop_codon:yes gene_type:complete
VINTRVLISLKWFLAALLLVAAVGILGAWALYTAEPQRSGQLKLAGLQEPVSVSYDAWGVPHIDAQNDHDAYRALGYLHAQDRLFQMDMLRRIGAGRLSELFGQDTFETDRFFRSLGISRFARQYAQRLDAQRLDAQRLDAQRPETNSEKPHVELIQAYQAGINHYIDSGKVPLEYRLLLTRPDYFDIADIAHVMGYMAYSFAEAFKTDALIDHVRGNLGERHAQDLVPGWPETMPPRRIVDGGVSGLLDPLLQQISKAEEQLPAGQFLGSNAWVVNSTRSLSNAPLLANDPHIGYSAPAVWFEAHIRTPEHEVYGHFLAGIPFPLLGQTRRHAWGLTMLMNDEVDFYRERVNPDNPNQVRAGDAGWQNLTLHEEVIKVRGHEDRLLRMRSSRHGPIINDPMPGIPLNAETAARPPVSLFWSFLNPDNDAAEAFYGLPRANTMVEFEQAAALHGSPGLNLIYADIDDNIAMWAIGTLKRWPSSNNSYSLLSGSSGRDDFLGYQPFSANPRVINPSSGHIFSANNPYPGSGTRRVLPGYYAPSERAERLKELLDNDEQFDLARFKDMQLDTRRPQALAVLDDALPLLSEQLLSNDLRVPAAKAAEILSQWNGAFTGEQVGATLFQRWQDQLMEALFADELGPQFAVFRNTEMAEKSLFSLYWKPASPWWDNRLQPVMDGRQAAIEQAWVKTIESLSAELGTNVDRWTWDQVISLQHTHPLSERMPLGRFLDSQQVAVDGGAESLNSMSFNTGEGHYRIKAGPSTRRLVDLSDMNRSLGINPMGQSGNPFNDHYQDQAELFNQGRYRGQLFDWQAIKALPDQLTLQPSPAGR